MRSTLRVTMLVALTAGGGIACSTARASAPIERPPLEVPPPPPRVIVPLPPPEQTWLEPVTDLPPAPGNATPARPRTPPREKPDPPKPDPKTEAPPPDQTPATQPAPVPQIRTPESVNPEQMKAQIQDMLNRARAILGKVDGNSLPQTRKKTYEDAKLFAQQADEALKASNLVFARELAEKAERLAKEFQGR